jgi:hypothetical protein
MWISNWTVQFLFDQVGFISSLLIRLYIVLFTHSAGTIVKLCILLFIRRTGTT